MAKKTGKAKSKKRATGAGRKKKKPLKSFKQLGRALKAKAGKLKAGHAVDLIVARKVPQATRHLGEIKPGKRFRKDLGDVASLARSIDERGALLHPVVITPANTLIAGERRMAAWKLCALSQQGKLPIPVTIVDIDAIVAGERDENAERKDFTPSEMVAIKKALEPLERRRAKERQAHGMTAPGKPSGPTMFGTPEKPAADTGRAADKVAAATGRDRKTVNKAEAVVDAAKKEPEKYGKLVEDMDRTGRVDGPFKRLQNMQASEKIRGEPSPLPGQGPYRAGIIDFPWPADPEHPERTESRGYYPYPTMPLPEIDAFDIRAILHADAAVGVWITNFHLARGDHLAFLKTNDLTPVAIRTWAKPHFGQGQVLRGQTEHMIIATRGNPTVDGSSISTLLTAPAGKEHSEKPAQSYVDFERLVAAPRYFELFARRPMPPNWDGHGNQVGTLVDTGQAAKAEIDPTRPLKVKTLLEALEAIEAGRAIAVTGKKITDQVKRYTTGSAKKPKLNKDGVTELADLRRKRDDDEKVTALPTDQGELRELYTGRLVRLNAAVLAGDKSLVETLGHELYLIARAANKGDNHDRGEGGSNLRDTTAAPIGIVPLWGQRGMFPIEVDGVPYIVAICSWLDDIGQLDVYATDPQKPCILAEAAGDYATLEGPWFDPEAGQFGGEHGWMNDVAPEELLGKTVEDYCRAQISALGNEKRWIGGRKRKPTPALPEAVFRLPESWGEVDFDGPIQIKNSELAAVRPTESMVKRQLTHGEIQQALMQIEAGSGIIGNAKLADELLEQKLVAKSGKGSKTFKLVKAGRARLETYRAIGAARPPTAEEAEKAAADALRQQRTDKRNARTSWPAGHIVSMTLDHDAGDSVATCECGFVARVPRDGKSRLQNLQRAAEMDDKVEAHWVAVEAGPNPPAQEGMFDGERSPPAAKKRATSKLKAKANNSPGAAAAPAASTPEPAAADMPAAGDAGSPPVDDGLFDERFRAKPKKAEAA